MLSIRYWIYNVWWFSTVYTALNVSYFFEARRGRLRGSLRECSIHVSRVYSRLSSVTKIKMYASRTHRESTSGEVEACHINHPPLKISSSAQLGLREADHAAANRAATFYYGCLQKKKKKRKNAHSSSSWNRYGGKILKWTLSRWKFHPGSFYPRAEMSKVLKLSTSANCILTEENS